MTVTEGTNVLLGLDPRRVLEIPGLLAREAQSGRVPALWDGRAGEPAATAVLELVSGEAMSLHEARA